jgi:hypothetical protein
VRRALAAGASICRRCRPCSAPPASPGRSWRSASRCAPACPPCSRSRSRASRRPSPRTASRSRSGPSPRTPRARVLARTALLETRLHAARLLLGDDASPAPRDLFDELGARLFGASLDARLRGAWPVARDDEPARFVALLEARPFVESLRERFDADWFRNPHAWTHLRALAAGPAREPVDAASFDARVDAIGRAFEGALG